MTKKTLTKEQQITAAAKRLLNLAKENGQLDELCDEGKRVVGELAELVGAEIKDESSITMTIDFDATHDVSEDMLDSSKYEVIVKRKGVEISNINISDVSEW